MKPTANLILLALTTALAGGGCTTPSKLVIQRHGDVLRIGNGTREVAAYNLRPPKDSGLPLEAGGYFHPLMTPGGVVVTDFVPSDHKHHRGLFLAWVELHGVKDADFWGWGAHAPVKDRRIVNRSVTLTPDGFVARNDWVAEDVVMIEEELTATVTMEPDVNVLDLVYRLTPRSDVTLSRWAFSGFCLRVRKDGDMRVYSPAGMVSLPNPVHTEPATDWPDAPWYACEQRLTDGRAIGAAVINHPANPPTLWHNQRDVRMINPCIVAPGDIKLTAGIPLVLRYRVVTFDGALRSGQMNRLAADFSRN